ncbi:hypothetical protein MRB53_011140 [Persea americana]|uniref:Uncharacterized protein n=1 Tax=Persea americana TaxID=3435 RepID=A0ACC2LUL7_PERAE|nr:hypothetical protein MRB53_011140 [Persea americana]
MTLSFLRAHVMLILRRPVLLYAATWTAVLTVAVAVASFSPEMAFVWAVSPSSGLSNAVCRDDSVRIPLERPKDVFCLPAQRFGRSKIDYIVPLIFAGVVVASSACLVRAIGLWEDPDQDGD